MISLAVAVPFLGDERFAYLDDILLFHDRRGGLEQLEHEVRLLPLQLRSSVVSVCTDCSPLPFSSALAGGA